MWFVSHSKFILLVYIIHINKHQFKWGITLQVSVDVETTLPLTLTKHKYIITTLTYSQLTHNNIEKLQTDQNSQTPTPFINYNDPDFKEKNDVESSQLTANQQEYIDKVCKIQQQYRKHKQVLSTKVINLLVTYYAYIGDSIK